MCMSVCVHERMHLVPRSMPLRFLYFSKDLFVAESEAVLFENPNLSDHIGKLLFVACRLLMLLLEFLFILVLVILFIFYWKIPMRRKSAAKKDLCPQSIRLTLDEWTERI